MIAPESAAAVVSAGQHRYRCDHHWAKLPRGFAWGITHGVALDQKGRVFIAHTGTPQSACADTVFVFDPDGNFVDSWGSDFWNGAHGLEIAMEDGVEYAYLTDLERGLFKLSLDGEVIWRFEKPALYRKAFGLNWRPSNCALAPGTDVYLSDGYGSAFIVRIDRRTGVERDMFGGPGKGDQPLFHPHGLTIDQRRDQPELLVADNIEPCFRYFDLDGRPLRRELEGDSALIAPRHFAWHGDELLVPDLGGRLTFFDAANHPTGHLGSAELPFEQQVAFHNEPPQDCPPGMFRLPHDAAFDVDGNLFVVEWIQGGRVSKLCNQNLPLESDAENE